MYTSYRFEDESQVNNWIRYAVACNVEEVKLTLGNGESADFSVDQNFFIGSCFTDLRLSGCVLSPTGAINWKNLKSLYIYFAELSYDLIENILLGSPVLETLILDDCYGYPWLDITSKSVNNLVLSVYMNPEDEYDDSFNFDIEIYAPDISSLAIQGDMYLWKLLLIDVSSVTEAKLDYTNDKKMSKEAEEEMLKGFILKLGHVKELKIGSSCSKVVSRLEAKSFVFPSNVKFVESD